MTARDQSWWARLVPSTNLVTARAAAAEAGEAQLWAEPNIAQTASSPPSRWATALMKPTLTVSAPKLIAVELALTAPGSGLKH